MQTWLETDRILSDIWLCVRALKREVRTACLTKRTKPIILNQAANEIAEHKGNVWSHVVSLRREDAVRLGYDNSDVGVSLSKGISQILQKHRISLFAILKWYAAYHDTTHHPHIHLLVYSTNPKQGFLTKAGIDKIRFSICK